MRDRTRSILLKKSLRGYFSFPTRKSTSQIGLQTARAPVKGKRTPENLATETVSDFFSSIGHFRTAQVRRDRHARVLLEL